MVITINVASKFGISSQWNINIFRKREAYTIIVTISLDNAFKAARKTFMAFRA